MEKTLISVSDERKPLTVYFNIELNYVRLTPYEFRIYNHLACLCAGTTAGIAEQSLAEMSAICCMSLRQASRAIDGLLSRQMIKQKDRPGMKSRFSLRDKSEWKMKKGKQEPMPDSHGYPCLTVMGNPCLTVMGTHDSQSWVPNLERSQISETQELHAARNLNRSKNNINTGSNTHVSFFHGENAEKKAPEKKKKNGVVNNKKTSLPSDFEMTPAFLNFCKAEAPNIDPKSTFNAFCDNARMFGHKFVDWNAALRGWTRKAESINTQKGETTNDSHRRDDAQGVAVLDKYRR